MGAEIVFKEAVVTIATGAAIVRFAILEYEGVLAVWKRVAAAHKDRVPPDSEPHN